jgi:hypothetical protein
MKILFISATSENNLTDYMNDLTLHGLRELYGNDVVDYPGCWYLYSDEVKKRNFDTNKLWGKGFNLNDSFQGYDLIDRNDISTKIKSKYFDLIIYGSIRRSSHFLDEVINNSNKYIFIDGEDDRFIEERYTSKSIYFKRELLTETSNIKPINFSIPKNKIIKEINRKPKNLLSPLIPGRPETYIYKDEKNYNQMYQNSVFALTYRKGGWDCFRHYEILMNGCIPFHLEINKCPNKTLEKLPKDLLKEILKKYEWILSKYNPFFIYKKKFLNIKKIMLFLISSIKSNESLENFIHNNEKVFEIKSQLLNYTKNNLTTELIAKGIIERIQS